MFVLNRCASGGSVARISSAFSAAITVFGVGVDIDAEFAQVGPTGYRPLCVRDTLF
ncbi:hypothetical protein [Nocardia vaccinii]|uniref:hypothetical protein n=1 Tax=Nocardia vaccinii TaxID=1822 RepID=UPI000A7FA17B|nr:hypothetical protein [Nocardia vaccinii]